MKMLKLYYRHWHIGNDPERRILGSAQFATECRAVDQETGDVIAEAWAYANPKDSPTRAKGREISRGRVLKELKSNKIDTYGL